VYDIRLGEDAQNDLRRLPVHVQRRIVAAMNAELKHHPTSHQPPRKLLAPDLDSGIVTSAPVWQLRVGDYRIFYDVDEVRRVVMAQRVARKGRKTTREVLK
jgi:mRNA-degrading endonuclease RelE of RelBE toxin-antitoxin system